MRAVVQRVSSASVLVDGENVGAIGEGLLVYLGVARDDDASDATQLADRIVNLRTFPDGEDRMNLSVIDAGGAILCVSAFTVQADARKGRRPTFETAAAHEDAKGLYEGFCDAVAGAGVRVERGVFRAMMQVHCENAGPVCILLDSKKNF